MKSTGVTTLLSAAGLAAVAAAAAEPKVVSFDFAKTSHPGNSKSFHKKGFKRSLLSRAAEETGITSDSVLYYINMSIGTPPQKMAAYVDTGSSDLWLPDTSQQSRFCQTAEYGCGSLGGFDDSKSSSFKILQGMGEFATEYGDGTEIVGEYFTDDLNIGDIKLTNVTMALALKGETSYPVNGIMGIGYNANEAPPADDQGFFGEESDYTPYPNVISQMKNQGKINTLAYSLFMNDLGAGKGTIIFGGIDKAKYTGPLSVVSVIEDPAAASYEQGNGFGGGGGEGGSGSGSGSSPPEKLKARQSSGSGSDSSLIDAFYVSMSGLSFSNNSASQKFDLGDDSIPVLLDSGTSLVYLPDKLVASIYSELGVGIDKTYGPLVRCDSAMNGAFSFQFGSGGPSVNVSMSQMARSFTADMLQGLPVPTYKDGSKACSFGLMGAGDSQSSAEGEETPFILGDTFLSSAYVVFDMTNNEIGLAQGNPNATSSNIIEISSTIPADSTATAAATAVTSSGARTTRHAVTASGTAATVLQGDGDGVLQTFAVTAETTAGTLKPSSSHGAGPVAYAPSTQTSGLLAALVTVLGALSSGVGILAWL